MASGGGPPYSKSATEPRSRRGWQRTASASDKEDNVSINSLPNELRPNNWDFSDWKPSSTTYDSAKRRKKGNPEWEREQSLSQDSPPPSERHQRTPSTFPRTRITPLTPTSQRVALEKLKQQLTFSDQDDVSNDGERNNEKNVARRGQPVNYQRQDMSDDLRRVVDTRQDRRGATTNSLPREMRDRDQIVGRLMQIREYIKQANSMMTALQKSGNPHDLRKASQLYQVIVSLRQQEQSYLDVLQRYWQAHQEDFGKLRKLADNLQEQERSYLGLLQQLLSLKEDTEEQQEEGSQREVTPTGLFEDTQSLDFDARSETSEATTELSQNSANPNRPRIEDKLGLDSAEGDEDETEDVLGKGGQIPGLDSLDNTLLPSHDITAANTDWDHYDFRKKEDGKQTLEAKEKELKSLLEQQELLKKLAHQQEQMKALRGRQQALLALQRDAQRKLAEAKARDMQAKSLMKSYSPNSNPSRVTNNDESQEKSDTASDSVPPELQEIRQRLNYLKNELKDKNPRMEERQNNMDAEAAAMALDDNRRQLQEKLLDLQEKKRTMDQLLNELQGLRSQRYEELLNNGLEPSVQVPQPSTQSTSHVTASQVRQAEEIAERTESDAKDLIDKLESREKLQKLQEVKARLNQLRSLISYYDTANAGGNPPEVDEQTAFRNFLEYGEPSSARNNRLVREPLQERSSQDLTRTSGTERIIPIEIETKSDDDNLSKSDSSETESKLSSLGPWGDDPEIQEKVRKLKEAKGKLKQLQDLVTVVQQSPDAARALPDNLADLAASLEEDADSVIQADDKSDGEIPMTKSERDNFYEAKMQEQMRELDQLKDERRRLLTIQQQLQSLHDRFTVEKPEAEIEEIDEEDKDITITKKKVEDEVEEEEEAESDRRAPVVTFSSNDEVYDKMRKQRIIREELRSKKRELEAIMKKDNKKHYSKNQDNQSDTVSFSTADAFGVSASADATMATWGGSTVDNLESITEDGNPEGNDGEDDDDAYPSDGIIQVEEEEEENDYDNETYTIEDDVRQNVQARSLRRPASEGGAGRTKKRQTYPRAKRETKGGARPKQAWSKYGRKDNRVRQENYRSAEDIIQDDVDGTRQSASSIEALQQQLERTASLCQTLMRDQQSQSGFVQAGYNFRPSMSPDVLQQSLQHQQVLMSLNQCFQQMSMQQMEIQNMQRRMQALQEFEQRNSSGSAFGDDLRLRSLSSLPLAGDSRGLSPNFGIFPPRPDNFSMQPHFPNDFHSMRNTPGSLLVSGTPGEDSVFEIDRQNSQQNKISQHTAGVRKKSGSASQFLRTDSQTQIGKKISPGSSSRNLSQRTQQPKQEDTVPPLNIQDILRKKRKQNMPRNWSNVSLASSNQVSTGLDATGIASKLQQRLQGGSSSQYRPGLSAGISGAGFLEGESVTSNQSSRPVDNEDIRDTRDTGDADLSLFEALREKIYSEVATLISQNENRPHFLIELFCELQLFTTDYLRQRVLYCIKDVISKYLTDGNGAANTASAVTAQSWMNPNITASELTPSESAITSEDEELKYKAKAQSRAAEKKKLLARAGSLQDDQFDYMENADNDSSLSTPSNSYWENPFSQDALGDTVINLDKALRKMREQEERFRAEEKASKLLRNKDRQESDLQLPSGPISEPTSSSAVDQGSESSVTSSINNPKIDTQKVDQQIKEIMTEVIPVIKEHMDNVCSSQLITYIKRLVLSLTRQRDATQYTRFFRSQMGSALQDTLDKFEGKKMRECGEDLLVDMSEVLFNELAFFRLMEDYGDPLPTDKLCSSATQTQEVEDYGEDGDVDQSDESDTTESTVSNEEVDESNSSMKLIRNEEEELGKARDDEFASEVQIQDDDKDEDTESPYTTSAVQIELAVSETKPFTRIGSDEDDEDADESLSADDQPSETAVSRDVMMEKSALDQDDGTTDTEAPLPDNTEGDADQGANSTSSPIKDKEIKINGINGEIVENGEITTDDLPASLNIPSQDDLQKKIAEEEISNDPVNSIINNNNNGQDELAGDGEFLKEPDDIVSG